MKAGSWAAGLALALALPAYAHADTLIDHVNGIAADPRGGAEHFTGMIVGDDGRVVVLLHAGERRPRTTYANDGNGATLIPGLVLAGAHLMRLGLLLIADGHSLDSLPAPRPEDRDVALAKAQAALLARGITTVADFGETIEDWQALRRAGDAGRLAIRVIAYADGPAQMALIGGPGPGPWLYDGRLKAQGMWLNADGAGTPAGLIALKNRMSRAALDHFQVTVTVSAAHQPTVDAAITDLAQTYGGDRRWLVLNDPPAETAPDLLGGIGTGDGPDAARLADHTATPARAVFADGVLGCLNPGCRADFLLLAPDGDAGGAAPQRLREVWVGGVRVVESQQPAPPVKAAPGDSRGTGADIGR